MLPRRILASPLFAIILVGVVVLYGTVGLLGLAATPAGTTPGGVSLLAASAEASGIAMSTLSTTPHLLEDLDPARTTLLVTDPIAPMSASDPDAIVRFVDDGGRLVVATTDTRVNVLSIRFGIRYDGAAVLSSARPGPPTLEGSSLVIDPLTSLALSPDEAPGAIEVILTTSPSSFLDLDADGTIDEDDRDGPFVAAASVALENGGQAIFVAGSSPLRDAAFDAELASDLLGRPDAQIDTLVIAQPPPHAAFRPGLLADGLAQKATRQPVLRAAALLATVALAAAAIASYRGPPPLRHEYRGGERRFRDVPRADLARDLKLLLLEHAREESGLTPLQFEALPPGERAARLKRAIASLGETPEEARVIRSLKLLDVTA